MGASAQSHNMVWYLNNQLLLSFNVNFWTYACAYDDDDHLIHGPERNASIPIYIPT